MSWTPEMDAALTSGFRTGLSARLVAEKLGVTRNAVLGRHFRMGLSKPKPSRKPRADTLTRLGRAARACGFTVEMLEEIRLDQEADAL